MRADLVRCAVIDAQRERAAADIKAKRLPGKGLLKDALAKIPGEEEAVAAHCCHSGEEPGLGHTQILRLVNHGEVVGASTALAESIRQTAEDVRPCHNAAFPQPSADALKDGPQGFALLAANPGLPPEARHVAVILPRPKLPGVHDVVPLSDQELGREPVSFDFSCCFRDQRLDQCSRCDLRLPKPLGIKVIPNCRDRLHDNPRRNQGLIAHEAGQLAAQGIRQRLGERRQQDLGRRIGAGKMDRTMQRHDGFSCPGRTRNPGRTGEGSLDKVSLGRMQKDRPLVPRIVERLLQFFCVGQNAEAALGVRVSKRIGFDRSRFGRLRFLAHSQFQQSFLRLLRQVLDDVEQCVLGDRPDVIHPFLGHAKGHQFELAQIVEKADRGLCDRRRCSGHLFGLENFHLFNPLAHLDKLHGARGRVAFNLAAFGPFVGVVVVVDIDQQDASPNYS
ncbi:hypothetical protein EV658_1451 [Phaeovulum veldkampii DSM 11550]|nr:hypothetical protein EV658_1451 [Phaeovulum veldkampii DSM 11550]